MDTVLIVDLDQTLVKTNTTFELMKILCPLKYAVFSRIFKLVFLLNAIFKKDFYKLIMTTVCIKGREKECLEHYAKIYYKLIKKKQSKYYNADVLGFIRKDKSRTKVLLTASLDFIANNFKELGFNIVVASKTYYKNGKFYSLFDLYGHKSKILKIFLRFFDKIIVIDNDPEPAFYTLDKKVIVTRFPIYDLST